MKSFSKRAVLQSALAAAALASSLPMALAQDNDRQVRPPAGGNVLTLKCCHCTGTANTFSLNTGAAPWKIVSGGATAVVAPPHPAWASAPPAQWIGPNPSAGSSAPVGGFTYQLRILIPKCIVPSSITIKGQYWGDDQAQIAVTGTGSGAGGTWSATPANYVQNSAGNFSYTLPMSNAVGTVTLTVKVQNAAIGPNPTGFLVHGELTQRCASDGPVPVSGDLPVDKKE